jgi:hypothetical protein
MTGLRVSSRTGLCGSPPFVIPVVILRPDRAVSRTTAIAEGSAFSLATPELCRGRTKHESRSFGYYGIAWNTAAAPQMTNRMTTRMTSHGVRSKDAGYAGHRSHNGSRCSRRSRRRKARNFEPFQTDSNGFSKTLPMSSVKQG